MTPPRRPTLPLRSPDPARTRLSPVSVEVLPFAALTPDERVTGFASILFDEVVIALTLYRDVAVRLASAAPGNGFRITGSIRPSGGRMQASVRVLDPSGGIVLAQRFDLDWTSAHQPLDDFVVAVAGALTAEIVRAETEQALRKTSDLTAREAVARSVSAYSSINITNLDFAVTEARRAPISYFSAFRKGLAHFMLGDLSSSEAALFKKPRAEPGLNGRMDGQGGAYVGHRPHGRRGRGRLTAHRP